MKEIRIRNLTIGKMPPKICIPLMGEDYAQMLEAARCSLEPGADLYEVRGDYIKNLNDKDELLRILSDIRSLVKNQPIIFTLRSEEEGGKKIIGEDEYVSLNTAVIESGLADIIDVEIDRGKDVADRLAQAARARKLFIILSKHFFNVSLKKEEIIDTFIKMQLFPSDMHKIAVKTETEGDLLELFAASLAMRDRFADRPFVAIAMGEKGVLSRIGGGVFGSAITFAKSREASAPGQLEASDVRSFIDILHR